jgi:hypothetical protein
MPGYSIPEPNLTQPQQPTKAQIDAFRKQYQIPNTVPDSTVAKDILNSQATASKGGDPTGLFGQIMQAIGSVPGDVTNLGKSVGDIAAIADPFSAGPIQDLAAAQRAYDSTGLNKITDLISHGVTDVGSGIDKLIGQGGKTTKTKSKAKAAAPAPAQPNLIQILSQAIAQTLAPQAAQLQSLAGNYSADMAPFISEMGAVPGSAGKNLQAAYQWTDPGIQSALGTDISANTTAAQGTPALTVMQNLLGQMQNRALYYGLPLSQVYGNVTNPALKALINSPTLQGLSSTDTSGSTQIGPDTYSSKPKKQAQGYGSGLPPS